MRKFFPRIVSALRTAEWTSSLGQYLSNAEWIASTVRWFTRHVAGAVVVTGLSATGLVVAVRALDWSLILQWVVGVCWVILCVFIGYKVNQKINKKTNNMTPVREEGEMEMVEPPAEKQIRASTTTSAPPEAYSSPAPDDTNTWITEAEALQMIRSSSLVRLRLPQETTTLAEVLLRAANFVLPPTGPMRRADEISRHLLKKFTSECSWGVRMRSGTYNSELLREWIDQEAYREDPPTGYRAKQ